MLQCMHAHNTTDKTDNDMLGEGMTNIPMIDRESKKGKVEKRVYQQWYTKKVEKIIRKSMCATNGTQAKKVEKFLSLTYLDPRGTSVDPCGTSVDPQS